MKLSISKSFAITAVCLAAVSFLIVLLLYHILQNILLASYGFQSDIHVYNFIDIVLYAFYFVLFLIPLLVIVKCPSVNTCKLVSGICLITLFVISIIGKFISPFFVSRIYLMKKGAEYLSASTILNSYVNFSAYTLFNLACLFLAVATGTLFIGESKTYL